MTRYVSQNAKDLLEIICREHALQAERVAGGFIERDQVMTCLVERLNARSAKNESLRQFLASDGYIPPIEDESPDVGWAKDPRPPSMHVAHQGTSESNGDRARDPDWEAPWPGPGDRIA